MNQIDPNSLLVQMRALASRMQSVETAVRPEAAPAANFANVFKQTLAELSATQQQAAALATSFERGDPATSIADVMIALQKADVSFQAVTQVRNRLVNAYQEVMNMPI
jgi:flagellar hook-basal body complex protein FliE